MGWGEIIRSVDWRRRALAAEEQVDRLRTDLAAATARAAVKIAPVQPASASVARLQVDLAEVIAERDCLLRRTWTTRGLVELLEERGDVVTVIDDGEVVVWTGLHVDREGASA